MGPQLLLLLSVAAADPVPGIDFDTQIVPVLTRAGCNAGACHGAAAGRGGFHLSLFGSDAAADYEAIVQDLEGRRVNLVHADQSLILNKPTAVLKHGGGPRLNPDGQGAKLLHDWIASGAERSKTPRHLTSLEVKASKSVVAKEGDEVALVATARFDNVPPQDVSPWTVFTSTDSSAVEISQQKATVRRRGQHIIIARYLDRVVPVRLMLPFSKTAIDLKSEPRVNFIDDEVLKLLELLRAFPHPGEAMMRRFCEDLRLDLTGRLPAPEEVAAFLSDRSPDKRTKLVDTLLQGDDFVEYWTFKLTRLFRNHSQPGEVAGMKAFHQWIHESLRTKAPFDRMAREAVTAVGDSHKNGAAYFARLSADARGEAELTGSVFMGVRLQCANCHNHPLDRWTQDDYHGLAAIFARPERGQFVKVSNRGAITNPRTGEPAIPRIPGTRFLEAEVDGREAFAKWLTAPENPFFARAIVNRLWKAMFGRGLVEPADDLRDTNPATHPELLGRLAEDFVKHGYDLRHTLRLIAVSNAYGRSSEPLAANRDDDRFYSHAYRRNLEPEVLADAVSDVTGVPEKFGDEPVGTRAIALVNPATPSRALDILGRCTRKDSCEIDGAAAGLPAMLHRLNGELINKKITAKDGRLHRLSADGKSNRVILADLYPRVFGRAPRDEEMSFWIKQATKVNEKDRIEFLEDVFWSLLNSSEFTTNH